MPHENSDSQQLGGSPQAEQQVAQDCLECGKTINPETPNGVCADCSLRNLLNTSFNRTVDFGSLPLVEHPEMDITVDREGRAAMVEPLSPGEQIGPFEIVRRLGRGGMGTVYEAQDTENQRRIALKVLNRPVDDDAARQRFLREGLLAASINHPNSVFVFGTHQIDRHSLISMELVGGGTLEQRVRERGPLESRRAVDVALQIIDGLQAAYDRGILHRDIKPANCFEASDGTIKIGDFGLSISTDPDFDARVTTEGSLLGTPAFSSPEQLRGDALDVRSDIYALGVTLYYLLTGRTPYQADSLVKLLSQVFESSPPAPRVLLPDLSLELSGIVMRCLAKEPGDRFANYEALRTALLPLSSQVPEPASLGWRTIAGLVDSATLGMLGLLWTAATPFSPEPIFDSSHIASRVGAIFFTTVYILYFAVCESVWGQTVGKKLLGLKTVQLDGGRPRFKQTLLRAVMYVLIPLSIVLPYNFIHRVGADTVMREFDWGMLLILAVGFSRWGLFALLFSTARTRNGMAGLHDLASGTRVVSSLAEFPRLRLENLVPRKFTESVAGSIGPYQLLQTLSTYDSSHMYIAYDRVLLRQVWLRSENRTNRAPSDNSVRLSRATRLRWLNRFEAQGKVWDVYEAPTGGPFVDRLQSDQQLSQHLACWFTDLANELEAAIADGSVPNSLTVDHLWLTDSHRLKVLDFMAPDASAATPTTLEDKEQPTEATDVARRSPAESCRQLLQQLAPRIRSSLIPRDAATLPPPLYVTKLLSAWEHSDRIEYVLQATRKAASRRPMLPRRRRLLMSAACYALPIAQVIFTLAYQIQSGIFFAKNDDLRQLRALVYLVQENEHAKNAWKFEELIAERPELEPRLGPDLKSYGLYQAATQMIAGNHPEVLEDPRMKSIPALVHFYPALRQKIAVAQANVPTESELANAIELLEEPIREQNEKLSKVLFTGYGSTLMLSMTIWLMYVALPAVMAGFLFRGGLVVHGFQAAIVRMNGQPAGRTRIFLRAMLTALPGFVALSTLLLTTVPIAPAQPQLVHPLLVIAAVGLAIASALVSNLFGVRSIADRLMGTAVVAR
ncbi:MAG: protein kinase [Pirellulaceae bacterium]